MVPQLGRVVQVDDAIGAPHARTTFGHSRPRTAIPAGLPRPGNQLVCTLVEMNSMICSRIPFPRACCSGMGRDAGWSMRRSHATSSHAHRLLARSSLSSPAAAVFHKPSVEGLLAADLQPGVHRCVLRELSPRTCVCLVSVGPCRVRLSRVCGAWHSATGRQAQPGPRTRARCVIEVSDFFTTCSASQSVSVNTDLSRIKMTSHASRHSQTPRIKR